MTVASSYITKPSSHSADWDGIAYWELGDRCQVSDDRRFIGHGTVVDANQMGVAVQLDGMEHPTLFPWRIVHHSIQA